MQVDSLVSLISETLETPIESLSVRLEDLPMDSLEFLNLIVCLENASDIDLPSNYPMESFKTVGDLTHYFGEA